MRLRRQYKNRDGLKASEENKENEILQNESIEGGDRPNKNAKEDAVKIATPVDKLRPMQMIKRLLNNPNLNMQILLILITLTSENVQMDRRLDNMSTTMEKLRNINEVINSSMQSLKAITEVPQNVRRILK